MAKENKLIKAVNFRDFDWNKAKLFYHIAKCGSFNKAGRLAGTDQATLTRQIQALEKQIGTSLLIRKPGGIVLTRKGEELLSKVTPFFLEMRGFCDNMHTETRTEQKRNIRIVTTRPFAAYIFSDLILNYTKKNPHISFDLIGDDHLTDIILKDADIAIHSVDSRFKEKMIEGVQYEQLFSVQRKLYASEEYLKRYGEPQKVDDLVNHRIIAFTESELYAFYKNINWILTLGMAEGKFHKPVYTSNSLESLVKAAEMGIGIIASYEEYNIIKNSGLINILPNIKDKSFSEYFIYPNYLKGDKIINDIKTYFTDQLNK